jgi:TolA-binding protein
MIDHERVHARLRAARQSRTGAIDDITASKKQLADAESEIEECLKEIETDEPVRPLLDQIERTAQSARDPAEQPTDGGTDFHGRRQRAPRKTATIQAERPDRKLRPTSAADRAELERLEREARG